jgi:serine/threonine protein kinase/tetratricopeptide (TPR) repeat protein
MKICGNCSQAIAEEITACPLCGGDVGPRREYIDDYRIEKIIHEGHTSIICRAIRKDTEKPYMLRIFTSLSGVNETVAERLRQELEKLKKLPGDGFVRHHEIQRSSDGLWYRVSEWIEAESWIDLVTSKHLDDGRVLLDIFQKTASTLAILHEKGHIIPFLNLGDIMIVKDETGELTVKIDYKFSRFLDPKLPRSGPMLKRLIECHPDIKNRRPLDFRSDIWSLGIVFLELLTGDLDVCDFHNRVDALPLPPKIQWLFKSMLAEDPDLRPQSMNEVARILSRVNEEPVEDVHVRRHKWALKPMTTIQGLKKNRILLTAVLVVLVALGGGVWHYFDGTQKDARGQSPGDTLLENYANRYAGSVAFLGVDYWLMEGSKIVYRNQAEGTAFLVDDDGYLLTNRHVACPWLVDDDLDKAIEKHRIWNLSKPLRFGYKMYLWFDGEKAFNRSTDLDESNDRTDIYRTDSGFWTDGARRVSIAGVAKPSLKPKDLMGSPLMNDFAVLKINRVPEGLKPLPLDTQLDINTLPRLTPIITMGFPLGTKTLGATAYVSVTKGHIRRCFDGMVQVDASFYKGNSGGPVIDIHGNVIGIASRVAIAPQRGQPVFLNNRLSDFGLVLPISKGVSLLREIKAGQVKWNGRLDPGVEEKIARIRNIAEENRWAEAMILADKELENSYDPSLVTAAGMVHFCSGDIQGAQRLFSQGISMDADNYESKFMLFLMDWLTGRSAESPHRRDLLTQGWRSSAEFLCYLARILAGEVTRESALNSGYTDAEKSWIYYVAGLICAQQEKLAESERLLKEAVMAGGGDLWAFFLARAKLDQIQNQRLASYKDKDRYTAYQGEMDAFRKTIQAVNLARKGVQNTSDLLWRQYHTEIATPEDKRRNLEKILEIDSTDVPARLMLIVHCAMDEMWPQALEHTRIFLGKKARENANRLGAGLLEPLILQKLGQKDAARESLNHYYNSIRDPWYRAISRCLLGEQTEESLMEKARENSEYLLTGNVALGLWDEGSGEKEKAIGHYKEAMASSLENWLEYDLAKHRMGTLKRQLEAEKNLGVVNARDDVQ